MLAKEIVNAMMVNLLKRPDTNAKLGLNAGESENFTKLCMAFTCPTGTEDIRLLVSSLPDGLLKHMASMANNHKIPEPAKKLAKICLIEWCFRNGLLDVDWLWEWGAPPNTQVGSLSFKSKISLDEALERLTADKSIVER
jgi:hypothetical protein